MYDIVQGVLVSFVQVLKVMIPLIMVFDIVGDLMWKR